MTIFVTGINGQLGHDVMLELALRDHAPIGSGSGERCRRDEAAGSMPYILLDITDREAVRKTLLSPPSETGYQTATRGKVDR